jgi:hypothetical protein
VSADTSVWSIRDAAPAKIFSGLIERHHLFHKWLDQLERGIASVVVHQLENIAKVARSGVQGRQRGRWTPFMAGLVIVAASPSGPFGVVKEMFAVGRTLANAKLHGASSEIVKAIVAELETPEGRQQEASADVQGKSLDQVRAAALEACRQAAAVVDKKAKPDEAQASNHGGGGQGRWVPRVRWHPRE